MKKSDGVKSDIMIKKWRNLKITFLYVEDDNDVSIVSPKGESGHLLLVTALPDGEFSLGSSENINFMLIIIYV